MAQPTPKLIPIAKWMKKSSMHFFERNPSALAAPGFVPLCNQMVLDIMATGFEPFSRDTYYITCRARMILSNNLKSDVYQEDEVFKAETAINTHLDRLHNYFDTRIAQGEQKLELGGFGSDEIQRLVTNYETRSVTNAVTQYLEILAKADLYLTILHYLWVTSELSDSPDEAMRVKLNTEREVRQNLFGIGRFSSQHFRNIQRICNGVLDERQKDRERQSERDKAKAAERVKRQEEEKAQRQAAAEQRRNESREKRKSAKTQAISTAQSDMDSLSEAVPATA